MNDIAAPSLATVEPIDPLPAGRIGMWLVIVADLMFFLGLVGAFVVLRAGNADLFANHQRGLSAALAGGGVAVLILSSAAMFIATQAAPRGSLMTSRLALLATLSCAVAFVGLRAVEYSNALNHHTMTGRDREADPLIVYDGHFRALNGKQVIEGYAAPVPSDFDAHTISQHDVDRLSHAKGYEAAFPIPRIIFQDIRYGPAKNIFFAIWYAVTGAHMFHIAIGLIAIAVLLIQLLRKRALPKHVEYVGLYWHLVVFVGVILFPLLYLW
jgi:heme/copper-type cytochrome/quinol oxidase subunit 3